MLETVREFGARMLEESGEAPDLRALHLKFLRRTLGQPLGSYALEPVERARERSRAEIDNVRAALAWALEDRAAARDGLALAGLLLPLWVEGHLQEGCDWLARLLAQAGQQDAVRAGALYSVSQLTIYRSSFASALPYIEECVSLCRELGRREMLVQGLSLLATARRAEGEPALAAAREAVDLARQIGEPTVLLRALYTLGSVAFWNGDLTLAASTSTEAIEWGRGTILESMTAAPTRELGNVAYRHGDLAEARLTPRCSPSRANWAARTTCRSPCRAWQRSRSGRDARRRRPGASVQRRRWAPA
jgi:hypothetical protein